VKLTRVVLARLGTFVLSLLVASLIVFLLLNLLPGNVAQVILGSSATPSAIATLRQQLGLDEPVMLRYVHWLFGLFRGDFGTSAFTGESLGSLVAPKLGVTVSLVVGGMVLAVLVAVPVGMFAAMHRRQAGGQIVSGISEFGMSIPAFLAGIALVMVFAVRLRWLPANGYTPLTDDPLDWLRRLILPWVSLALVQAAVLVRYVRNAFIDVLGEDYLRTARSVGWRRRPALMRHGLRNAALQIVTVLGLQLSALLVGAVVIENVFVLPGLGSMLVNSAANRDLPIVQGIVMLLMTFILGISLLVDLAYLLIDPRLRTGTSEVSR